MARRLCQDDDFLKSPVQANTPLILAAGDKDYDEVRQLILQNIDVNARNVHGQSALHWAADFAYVEAALKIIDLLLDHGADINAQDNKGCTALMLAASRGTLVVVRHLLRRGANPNLKRDDGSPEGATVIAFLESAPSLRRGRKRVIKALEEAGGIR